jgi:hypothetical protein
MQKIMDSVVQEFERLFAIHAFSLTELPADYQIWERVEKEGYEYLRITVTDMATGNRASVRFISDERASN